MECRKGCGACCIAPSIMRGFEGMPEGKPAGVPCVHLDDAMRCGLFGRPERPRICAAFRAEPEICGVDRDDALRRITVLEVSTRTA